MFIERKLDVTFELAKGTFAESGTNTVTLSGLRTSAKVVKAGGPSMSTMQLIVYGMPLSLINQLSTLGMAIQLIPRNVVTVTAGDDKNGMGTVFVGTITNAYGDFQAAPEVAFIVDAHTGLLEAVAPVSPSSFKGPANVSVIMLGLATLMGLSFEDNLSNPVYLSNPYFPGAARAQAQSCADAAGIEWIIDNGVLAIWPRGGSRGTVAPLIAPPPDGEMIGYPSYTAQGILVRTIFNPSISFGGKINVRSSLTPANGTWSVFSLAHDLESKMPGGNWFSTIGAYNPAFMQTAPVLQ